MCVNVGYRECEGEIVYVCEDKKGVCEGKKGVCEGKKGVGEGKSAV